jgi:hypothetical protein
MNRCIQIHGNPIRLDGRACHGDRIVVVREFSEDGRRVRIEYYAPGAPLGRETDWVDAETLEAIRSATDL